MLARHHVLVGGQAAGHEHAAPMIGGHAVGMLQCNKCPPIVGARLFQYQFATPTAVQSTVVACDSKMASGED